MSSKLKEVTSERIQFTNDQEPSSITVKRSLYLLLEKKTGSKKAAKKIFQSDAVEAKRSNISGVSNYVFIKTLKNVLNPDILSKMSEEDFSKKINERIQYNYEGDASSLTIKYALFKALSVKFGSDQEAKKYCQKLAAEAREITEVGKFSNYVFDKALEEVTV